MSKKASKTEKSIKNQNKANFFPILHKFQSNNGEKREKSNSAKIWALLLFSSLFSRLLFSRFLFEFLRKNSNDFSHFMQDLYLSRHMACCCGIKMQFLRKNSNKSVKNQKREKSAKIWNKRFWKTITNSTTNYKLYLRLQIMILPEWQFRSDSWHENLCLKKCTGAHRPFKGGNHFHQKIRFLTETKFLHI